MKLTITNPDHASYITSLDNQRFADVLVGEAPNIHFNDGRADNPVMQLLWTDPQTIVDICTLALPKAEQMETSTHVKQERQAAIYVLMVDAYRRLWQAETSTSRKMSLDAQVADIFEKAQSLVEKLEEHDVDRANRLTGSMNHNRIQMLVSTGKYLDATKLHDENARLAREVNDFPTFDREELRAAVHAANHQLCFGDRSDMVGDPDRLIDWDLAVRQAQETALHVASQYADQEEHIAMAIEALLYAIRMDWLSRSDRDNTAYIQQISAMMSGNEGLQKAFGWMHTILGAAQLIHSFKNWGEEVIVEAEKAIARMKEIGDNEDIPMPYRTEAMLCMAQLSSALGHFISQNRFGSHGGATIPQYPDRMRAAYEEAASILQKLQNLQGSLAWKDVATIMDKRHLPNVLKYCAG